MMNKTMQADTRLLSSSKLIDSNKRFIFFLIAFYHDHTQVNHLLVIFRFFKRIPGYGNMHELHLHVLKPCLKSYRLYHFHLFTFKSLNQNGVSKAQGLEPAKCLTWFLV